MPFGHGTPLEKNAGSKLAKADQLGRRVITDDEFERQLASTRI